MITAAQFKGLAWIHARQPVDYFSRGAPTKSTRVVLERDGLIERRQVKSATRQRVVFALTPKGLAAHLHHIGETP